MPGENDTSQGMATARAILDRQRTLAKELRAQRRRTPAARAAALRAILTEETAASERLNRVRELLLSERNKAQRTVVWAYACMLETDSSGLTILFDRFERREIAQIARALDAIGAADTRAALGQLLAWMNASIEAGKTWLDASEALEDQAKPINKRRLEHVTEMERCLLAYCEAHVEQLAAG